MLSLLACASPRPATVAGPIVATVPSAAPSTSTTEPVVQAATAAPTADYVIPITSGEAYVQKIVRTYGYKVASASSGDSILVMPEDDPALPRLLAWVRAEQARGHAIVTFRSYFQPRECPPHAACGRLAPMMSVTRDAATKMVAGGSFALLPTF